MSGPYRSPGPWTIATCIVALILLILLLRFHNNQENLSDLTLSPRPASAASVQDR